MFPIQKERFEALVAYTRSPFAAGVMSKELEWYSSNDEELLATIIVDIDNEFTAIILRRDASLKYCCINFPTLFKTIDGARENMFMQSKNLIKDKEFTNSYKIRKNQNIFDTICKKENTNKNFEKVRDTKWFSSARDIINEIMNYYNDIDGNFIKDFQTTGFDARLWELYLFAYFTEERLFINRDHEAPDFIISNGYKNAAIEAFTVNESQKYNTDIDIEKLTPEKIQELLRHFIPLKFGNSLFSKLNRKNKKGKLLDKYWEMEHVNGLPLVFAIADFHLEGSMCWSSTALCHYLYGMRHDWHVSGDGQLIITPIKISFIKDNDKPPINGFFDSKDAENVSAVLFSATGTISKFIRMGKIAGFGDSSVSVKYSGVCHDHSDLLLPRKFFCKRSPPYRQFRLIGSQ